jgi:hypothetical protein
MRTPRSRIKGELRRLFVKSTERNEAMKRDKYTCQTCFQKQSRKKGQEVYVECHHENEIDWDKLIDLIQSMLLCDPSLLHVQCVDCHKDITNQRYKKDVVTNCDVIKDNVISCNDIANIKE